MKTGKIYLIRHGQTNGNGTQYVGWEDLSLNITGHQQALAIAHALRDAPISAIYSSVLNRAIATAQPLAVQKKLPLHTCPLLNEIDYGEYQGRLKSELRLKLRKDYRTGQLPNGESLSDVYLRVYQFHESIKSSLAAEVHLAVVAHFWSIRMLLGILQNKQLDELFSPGGYKPANGTVYQVSYRSDKKGNLTGLSESYLDVHSQYEPGSKLEKILT